MVDWAARATRRATHAAALAIAEHTGARDQQARPHGLARTDWPARTAPQPQTPAQSAPNLAEPYCAGPCSSVHLG